MMLTCVIILYIEYSLHRAPSLWSPFSAPGLLSTVYCLPSSSQSPSIFPSPASGRLSGRIQPQAAPIIISAVREGRGLARASVTDACQWDVDFHTSASTARFSLTLRE